MRKSIVSTFAAGLLLINTAALCEAAEVSKLQIQNAPSAALSGFDQIQIVEKYRGSRREIRREVRRELRRERNRRRVRRIIRYLVYNALTGQEEYVEEEVEVEVDDDEDEEE